MNGMSCCLSESLKNKVAAPVQEMLTQDVGTCKVDVNCFIVDQGCGSEGHFWKTVQCQSNILLYTV